MATRRIKGNIKEDFPTVDDPVGKLEHIGKQTEEKLRDLLGAAANCGLDLMMPMMPAEWRTPEGVDAGGAEDTVRSDDSWRGVY